MMENLVEYYRKADGRTKNKILSCIFAEKFIIVKRKVATTLFTPQVQVLLNINKDFQRSKKQEVDFDLLSMMAPLPAQSCNQLILIS
jgi:site-specific DNA recombinase